MLDYSALFATFVSLFNLSCMAESLSNTDLSARTVSATAWSAFDSIGEKVIKFIVNLVLAWLLSPADFACIGLLAMFIYVSGELLDSGFGTALIQKKNPSPTDYSTIFYWNMLLSVLLYALLFVGSPLVASFFYVPQLQDILRVLGLVLIANALGIVQLTRFRKMLDFRSLAIVNLSAQIIGGVVAILLARQGWGVWSLVALELVIGLSRSLLLWIIARWMPVFVFSFKSLRTLFGFGGYMLASSVIQEVCFNFQSIVIGRLAPLQLGFYNQAQRLDRITSFVFPEILVKVLFPVYSSVGDNSARLTSLLSAAVRMVAYIVSPVLFTLLLVSEPLITTLYSDKWLPAVPYFRIFCVGGLFVSLQNLNYFAVASVGKSRRLFYWSFYKWFMMLIFIFIGKNWGMIGICWAMVVSAANIFIVNAALAQQTVGYTLRHQFADILPSFLTATVSLGLSLILPVVWPGCSCWIQAAMFLAVYIGVSAILRFAAFVKLCELLTRHFSKKTDN